MPDWMQPGLPPTSKELLRAVRRVRNNLHHGAKMIPTLRDYALIEAARRVLALRGRTLLCSQCPSRMSPTPCRIRFGARCGLPSQGVASHKRLPLA